jgi:site-specific DNA recombinase
VVVDYKVDRLTRSLADFAKIVEIFDAEGVSFVSVTQQFNTTTSMGRLTLNVLLSFAQFEREVSGERIRDKIAASKQKGMWMGCWVPIGYDRKDRTLTINETEAPTVRTIFDLFLKLWNVRRVQTELMRLKMQKRRCYQRRFGAPHTWNRPTSTGAGGSDPLWLCWRGKPWSRSGDETMPHRTGVNRNKHLNLGQQL